MNRPEQENCFPFGHPGEIGIVPLINVGKKIITTELEKRRERWLKLDPLIPSKGVPFLRFDYSIHSALYRIFQYQQDLGSYH